MPNVRTTARQWPAAAQLSRRLIRHSSVVIRHFPRGITLLEILVSMAILSMVLLVIAHAMNVMQRSWVKVRDKADSYRNTRLALDVVMDRLSHATLNPRWRPDTSAAVNPPYVSDSDLHFISGQARDILDPSLINSGGRQIVSHAVFFQAPFGQGSGTRTSTFDYDKLHQTLNAWGYFVQFGPEPDDRPLFMKEDKNQDLFPPRYRFRLMEFRQPAHELTLFSDNLTQTQPSAVIQKDRLRDWYNKALTSPDPPVSVIAENILALILIPLDPQHPRAIPVDASWDSRRYRWEPPMSAATPDDNTSAAQRNRLPPAYQLIAIALNEDYWARLEKDEALSAALALQILISNRFRDITHLEQDLLDVQVDLDTPKPNRRPIGYKILSIQVPLPRQ